MKRLPTLAKECSLGDLDMIDIEQLFARRLPLFMFGFFCFVFALRLTKGKPVLITPLGRFGALLAASAPALAVLIWRLFTEIFVAENLTASWGQFLSVLFIILVNVAVAAIAILPKRLWLLNVTASSVFDCLAEALQRNECEYTAKRTTGSRMKHYQQGVITIKGSHRDSSIEVTAAPFGQVWIKVKRKRYFVHFDQVFADFKSLLAEKRCDNSSAISVTAFFIAISLMVAVFI